MEMEELSVEIFQDYAYYYNLFYGDKNYGKEAETVKYLIEKYASCPVQNILNIGCGTGRHDRELHKLGYCVKGIDLSCQMIEIAKKEEMEGLEFEVGDAGNYRDGKKYDAVCSLFHVISYQNMNDQVLAAFETAAEALKKNGIFVFDAWYGPGVLTDRPSVRMKKLEDDKNQIIRYANPVMHANENVVDVCYDVLVMNKESGRVQKIEEVHSMRYFFYPEVKYYLEQMGFELKGCLDCDTLGQADYNSWTVYFVAVKK